MLRNILSILLITLVTFGVLINDAEARRFGGGRSFGMSRSASSFSRPASTGQGFSRPQGFGQTASPMSRWMGPLAGLAAGGLLASLFMGHGMGAGIMSWLLVGGLLFVAITLIRNKMRPQPYSRQENNYRNNYANDNISSFMRNNNAQQSYASSAAPINNYPIGFDPQLFLRDAKVSFMRLQTAYDQKNLNDIREFTTPEVTAEIQMQLQERGNAENITNVLLLEAELLNVENDSQMISGTEMQMSVASVRFTGQIQEDKNAAPISINEIWHFRKEVGSLRWIVAGVQQ